MHGTLRSVKMVGLRVRFELADIIIAVDAVVAVVAVGTTSTSTTGFVVGKGSREVERDTVKSNAEGACLGKPRRGRT